MHTLEETAKMSVTPEHWRERRSKLKKQDGHAQSLPLLSYVAYFILPTQITEISLI